MTQRSTSWNHCLKFLQAMSEYRWLWITPTVAIALAAIVYAAVRPATWKASQAFVVRDEAVGGLSHQGRFASLDDMKAFQETLLELARNPTGVAAAMKSLGPPPEVSADWPSEADIEAMRDAIKVTAPRGAEFGQTEVMYLSVTGRTRQQAIDRTEAIYRQLEVRLAELRNDKAASLIAETTDKRNLAQADLDRATARLEEMERDIGSDLGELRILNDSGSGDSNLRASLNQLKTELRQAQAALEANQQQERMLVAANQDPENLLATSTRLFDAQPALRQLKEGLLNAQLRTADLLGKMTEDHPLVQSSRDTEAQVRREFHAELAAALRGIRSDLEVNRRLAETLTAQHEATQQRLNRLASLRARYDNLVAELRQRTGLLERAQEELAVARASQTAAASSSLISKFDSVIVGSSPIGPSRAMIVAAGMLGGLLTGLGLVFLAMPTHDGRGRRWTDYLGYGRRASDRKVGRRASDSPQETAGAAGNRRLEDRAEPQRHAHEPAAPVAVASSERREQETPVEECSLPCSVAADILSEAPYVPPSPETTPVASRSSFEIAPPIKRASPAAEKRSLLAACLSELECHT